MNTQKYTIKRSTYFLFKSIYYIQSRNEFYRKGKETPTLDLKEEKKEYKRVKHIIKSSVPLKQAFNEVQNFHTPIPIVNAKTRSFQIYMVQNSTN